MIAGHDPHEVIRRLVQWADTREAVRAMILTSTRTNPHVSVDVFSDYDVVLFVTDINPFFTDRSWLLAFGEVLVDYWDPIEVDDEFPFATTASVTQYADGLKIDFRLYPVDVLQHVIRAPVLPARYDTGYTVLVDKDGRTDGMLPPTYSVFIPRRPDEATYQSVVNDFFSDAPYVAKNLWRDELLPAKYSLDIVMKQQYLRQMLEWRMEREYGWSMPAGNLGKGLKKQLPPDIWSQFETTFVGASIEDNWEALFRALALFRRVAIEVADDLGFTYPLVFDERVSEYVQAVQAMPHTPTSDD
jgi:aminoglycoside 6-adenylyltransferase